MARVQPFTHTSFSAGELSPFSHGRTDVAAYFLGLEEARNFIVTPQGSVHKRPGFRFLAEALDPVNPSRLLPFTSSTLDAYMLVVSAGQTRFFFADGSPVGGGTPLTLANPFTVTDLPELYTTQSADVLYIFSGTQPIHKIVRTGVSTFVVEAFEINSNGPYLEENKTPITVQASGTSGSISLTASAALFVATDVGRLIRFRSGGAVGYARITAFALSTFVNADIIDSPLAEWTVAPGKTEWALGVFSDTTGYPRRGVFHADRLWLSGPPSQPFRLMASNSGDFENFSPSEPTAVVSAQNSINLLIQAGQALSIQWLQSSSEGLVVGTSDGEVVVRSASTVDPISPLSVEFQFNTFRGSSSTDSVRVDRSILFAQRDARTVRELVYSEDLGSFQTVDLSIRAEHIFQTSKVLRLGYQQSPSSVIWALKVDGSFAGLTFEKDQQVFGWHTHTVRNGDAIEDIAVLTGEEDELWALVRRSIDGSTVRYIEKLDPLFRSTTPIENGLFSDSGLTITSGSPTNTWAGLDHLEGEEVSALVDGAVQPLQTVTGGSITTPSSGVKAQIGLPYLANILTLPIEAQNFPSIALTKRTFQVHLHLLSTLGGSVDTNLGSPASDILYRSISNSMNSPPPLFTGWKEVKIQDRFSEQIRLNISANQPLPFNLLAIRTDIALGDD